MTSKNGSCDGVDDARAASGSMKSRAKMVVVETTSEGEAMGRAAGSGIIVAG